MNLEQWKKKKKELNLTFDNLAEISNVPRRTIISIFSGNTPAPRVDTVEAIEKALGLNYPEMPKDAYPYEIKGYIPLVGQVVAGIPIESPENLESFISIDFPNYEEYFALRVKGDSMIGARIYPNDILIVHKQNYAENGDIIVASINGESTVKRYKTFGESVFLMPENTNYAPIPISKNSNLYIFGKVVRIMADI